MSEERAGAGHGPAPRPLPRGLIGPFSGRQLVLTIGVVLLTALVLAFVTAPIHTPGPVQPSPGATLRTRSR